ncbi:hypothetical protein HD841_001478 [Sphingomonas melonis]|uniref:Uncharacterized protein n=1 Tax=Sphingomonas melonis TaxID=152682 RepID=A0A7Y9FM55_9SPHN|nr:hypothetical protein [Sphingomonas melonis]
MGVAGEGNPLRPAGGRRGDGLFERMGRWAGGGWGVRVACGGRSGWPGQAGLEQFLPRQGEVARPKGVTEGAVSDVFGCVSSPSVMPSACHLPLAGEELGWMSIPPELLLSQEHWRSFVVVSTRAGIRPAAGERLQSRLSPRRGVDPGTSPG